MKKYFLFALLTAFVAIIPLTAQEWQAAELSYRNVPVYRVLDTPETFIVFYAKYGAATGTVSIPKRWAVKSATTPAKLAIRPLDTGLQPYLTIITKEGSFYKAYLNMPADKRATSWGTVSNVGAYKDDGKETLELEF